MTYLQQKKIEEAFKELKEAIDNPQNNLQQRQKTEKAENKIKYKLWEENHGTPWGEGLPFTYHPNVFRKNKHIKK